jgi:pilus assembly protein Flp/PilA
MNGRIRFKRWLWDETGVSMIEYGLLAALIAIVCVLAITGLGLNLQATYQQVCTAVATAVGAAAC